MVRVVDAYTVVSTHHQVALGRLAYGVDVVVEDRLLVIGHVLIDGYGGTYRAGDVNTSRIGANHDVAPDVAYQCIDAVAVQYSLRTVVGIEQQTAADRVV